ncbi:MAG: N-acetyltransferase [Spirochaetota bacterium]
MKIRKLTLENYTKVYALLRQSFPESDCEEQLVENLHKNNRPLHEWICIKNGRTAAYIAFSNAYFRAKICGLHLAPLAVNPDHQRMGIGSELLRFALRQEAIRNSTIFVLGDPEFYKKFGFEPCAMPICPFDENNAHFLALRNNTTSQFTVGYEPEFKIGIK